MSARERGLEVHRVLVALDAGAGDPTSLRAAAALAARLRAELHGLFVEDAAVLGVAELPFARQVSLSTGAEAPLTARDLEGEYRALAAQARSSIRAAAEGARVSWSFTVVRGALREALREASGAGDLVVLVEPDRPFSPHLHHGARAHAATEHLERSVLVMRGEGQRVAGRAPGPVLAVWDGTPAADRALAAATRLAVGGTLVVLAPRASEDATRGIRAVVGSAEVAFRVQALDSPDAGRLCAVASRLGADALVLDAWAASSAGALRALFDRAPCPVLLVR